MGFSVYKDIREWRRKMSREIKFKGKVKYNGNHYFSGEWVYGYFYKIDDKAYRLNTEDDDLKDTKVEVNINTVSQYTGLKDKNGKEIYEGDTVECWECGYEDEKSEYKIVYLSNQDYPAFDLWPQADVESNGLSHYLACGEIEIIGNIHEEEK